MNLIEPSQAGENWDLVVIGSGFGSMFFVHRFLSNRPNSKILFIEMGEYKSWEWQAEHEKNSDIDQNRVFKNEGKKDWNFTIGLGGSSNCWWGLTPRLHPTDFKMHSQFGVGADWPVDYDELVPYYKQAESIMNIAGPDNLNEIFPGTDQYPLPAHRLTTADEMIIGGGDPYHFAMPCAKASVATSSHARCCSNSTCNVCPVGAKFSGVNGMQSVFNHPGVSVLLDSQVKFIETANGVARKVTYENDHKEYQVEGDLIVLGANAIQSPFILLRSGIGGHGVGRYLGEKLIFRVEVDLDGLDHFDGGTSTTAMNLGSLVNADRSKHGTPVYMIENRFMMPGFRMEQDRWRQFLPLSIYVDDILDEENGVFNENDDVPVVRFKGFSEYCQKGVEAAKAYLPTLLKSLPVEEIRYLQVLPYGGHIQGTLRMGTDISNSVVDRNLIHHDIRNLVVVGTSVFPTTGSLNPTLTASALSLRAADQLTTSGATGL